MTIITARGKSKSEQFNNMFDNRPVWALASNNTLGTAQPVLSYFDEDSHLVPMLTTGPQATDRSRSFATEVGSTYGFSGQTGYYTLSSAANPATGYLNINMFHQTSTMANFEAYSSGWSDYFNGTLCAQIPRFAVPIVGEKKWRQIFDLSFHNNRLYKSAIGNVWQGILQNDNVVLTDVTQAAGVVPWNVDNLVRAAYNRNNKTIMFFEAMSAVASASAGTLTLKAHTLRLSKKIGADTTCAEIRDMMVKALKNLAGNTYAAPTFTLANIGWADATLPGMQNTQARQSFTPVLCNDGSLWIKVDGHNPSYLMFPLLSAELFGDFETLTPLAQDVVHRRYAGGAPSTFYGSASSSTYHYGTSYTMSDDNTVVALYQHAYQYIQGAVVFFCPTESAKANVRPAMFSDLGASANPYSIAPCGGPSFVMCESGRNQDGGLGAYIGKVELQHTAYIDMNNATAGVAPLAVTPQWNGGIYPTVSTSTLQGGNQVLKVMPKFEWM